MQNPIALPPGSVLLSTTFSTLAIALAALFVAALYVSVRRTGGDATDARRAASYGAVAATLWLVFTATAASLGWLRFVSPPTMIGLLVVTLVLALGISLSQVGKRLALGIPLALLVGFQGFRVIVELLLHRAYVEGLMPVQMSYAGRNFDIVSGISAILLGAWLATGRYSRRLVILWNAISAALLINILVVALLSAPTPMRVFMNEPANIWVTRAPWVWLPTVMVLAAIIGHLLVLRYLALERREGAGAIQPKTVSVPSR